VPAPQGDQRLILAAPDKASRRILLRAIKTTGGTMKASMYLSPSEKANKALAYRYLARRPVHIKDNGDIMLVT
jgi:hypothetical protein